MFEHQKKVHDPAPRGSARRFLPAVAALAACAAWSATTEASWSSWTAGAFGKASASVTCVANGAVGSASVGGVPRRTATAPIPPGCYAGTAASAWFGFLGAGGGGVAGAGPLGTDGYGHTMSPFIPTEFSGAMIPTVDLPWSGVYAAMPGPASSEASLTGAPSPDLSMVTLDGSYSVMGAQAEANWALLHVSPMAIPDGFLGSVNDLLNLGIITPDDVLYTGGQSGDGAGMIHAEVSIPSSISSDPDYFAENVTVFTSGHAPPIPVPEPCTMLILALGARLIRFRRSAAA